MLHWGSELFYITKQFSASYCINNEKHKDADRVCYVILSYQKHNLCNFMIREEWRKMSINSLYSFLLADSMTCTFYLQNVINLSLIATQSIKWQNVIARFDPSFLASKPRPGLAWFMVIKVTFNISSGQFYWWRKPVYP